MSTLTFALSLSILAAPRRKVGFTTRGDWPATPVQLAFVDFLWEECAGVAS